MAAVQASGAADREVGRITAQRAAQRSRAGRARTSLAQYFPSTRRHPAMWREGVTFDSPSPARWARPLVGSAGGRGRYQLPVLPSVGDLNPGMRDIEVWPSGARASSSIENNPTCSKASRPKLLLVPGWSRTPLSSGRNSRLSSASSCSKSTPQRPVGSTRRVSRCRSCAEPTNWAGQLWRAVFEFFISKLHTYRPLLSAIRNEYELVLEEYVGRLQRVGGMEDQLAELKRQGAAKLEELRAQHHGKLEALRKTSAAKERDVSRLEAEAEKLKVEVESVSIEIGQVEDRRQKVHHSNLDLCVSLQFYEDWLATFTRPENYVIMLKQSQAEFAQSAEELQKLKQACADRVPREDLDALLEKSRVLRESLRKRQLDGESFRQAADKINKNCDILQGEVAKLEKQVTGLTPRPALFATGPAKVDSKEITGNTTGERVLSLAQMVKDLSKEIEQIRAQMPEALHSDDEEEEVDDEWVHQEQFEGQGSGDDVPKFLQWEGKIKNRSLSKRDCEMLIKQFWREKDKADAKLGQGPNKRMSVNDWMYEFLHKKYTKPALIADMGYNLLDAALKFKFDADCEMFHRVMIGSLDESVYWEEFEMMDGLMQLLQKLDMADNGGKVSGKILKSTLLKALRKWFPSKSDIRFNKLKRCLSKEETAKGNVVHYVHLFAEDKDFNQGPFAEMIRDQHVDERNEYLKDLELALQEVSLKEVNEEINSSSCASALAQIDPKKPQKVIDEYVLRGFRLPKKTKIKKDQKIVMATFIENLARGVVKTSSKRDEIDV